MDLTTLKRCTWTSLGSNGETSTIHKTNIRGRGVIKKKNKTTCRDEYFNERDCLLALQGFKHFPTLYAYDDCNLTLYMSYCGKRLYPQTRPTNWQEQINTIIQTIIHKNIVYSDIKIDHLRVHNDNTIRLIDFGRSTVGPQQRAQDIHKIYKLAKNVKYE